MPLSYMPMKAVRVTGSEVATSHRGSMYLDMSYAPDQWLYAPFDCKVVRIFHNVDGNANTMWFESLTKVKGPKYEDFMVVNCTHMYDADFKTMGYTIGKVFRQGEKFYKAGDQGNSSGVHVHIGFSLGKFTGSGWFRTSYGTMSQNNPIHMWDAVYLRKGTPIEMVASSPQGNAYKDKWVYEPTVATMQDIYNKAVQTSATVVRMREKPSIAFPQVGTLPTNALIPITQISTTQADGYTWVKVEVNGVVGYSAIVSSITVVDVKTPLEQCQEELAKAKQSIDMLTTQTSLLQNEVVKLNAELKLYVPLTTTVYTKK